MEKPFYISQLPEKTQKWIKEKTKENFLNDGMSEEEAEQKANDFLDEKVYTAEETFGKDFWKSIDTIKDNFTPPGAKKKNDDKSDLLKAAEKVIETSKPVEVNEYLTLEPRNTEEVDKDEMADFQKSLDDYAAKNKKGRDDIPVTTRR